MISVWWDPDNLINVFKIMTNLSKFTFYNSDKEREKEKDTHF